MTAVVLDRPPARARLNVPGPDRLSEFVRRSQPWSAVRTPLPSLLRRALWLLMLVDLVWGIWLATIVGVGGSCRGPVCTVATLDGHAPVLLGCAGVSLVGLVAAALSTRGLAEVDGRELAGVVVSTLAGGAALLGLAVLVTVALVVALAVAAFVTAFTFTP